MALTFAKSALTGKAAEINIMSVTTEKAGGHFERRTTTQFSAF